MEPADLGERLARLLLDPPKPDQAAGRILEEVPWPWPEVASGAFLEVLRTIAPQLRAGETPPHPWIFTLGPGARSIGREHIGLALNLLENIQIEDPSLDLWARVLDVITEKLRLRRQFLEELNR
jgi:hypothetical protein